MLGTISSFYTTESVLFALAICAGVCLSVTTFSNQTSWDFNSTSTGLIFVMVMSTFWFLLFWFLYFYKMTLVFVGGIGGSVFNAIFAVNTRITIDYNRYEVSPEEYIFAALNLYTDIVYIPFYILELCSSCDEN
ncbi:protein lifeguard 2-like [Ptychodera flava]|uniref:protein lifeguard 2-like n=1 Tax=Ptychodera flava TaxID=63121 RepID=UPI00396A3979